MKLAPRGGMITPLVQVKGMIPLESAEGITFAGATGFSGTPVSATHDAPAALFNKSRREILVPMIVFTPRVRSACCWAPERGALYTVRSHRAPTAFFACRPPFIFRRF